jgi:hypothetical protein
MTIIIYSFDARIKCRPHLAICQVAVCYQRRFSTSVLSAKQLVARDQFADALDVLVHGAVALHEADALADLRERGAHGGAGVEFLASAESACRALGCDATQVSEALALALDAGGNSANRIVAERALLGARVTAMPAEPSALAELSAELLGRAEHRSQGVH